MGEGERMKKEGIIIFNRKNHITAVNVPLWKILMNYICWVLAGKPEGWQV